MRVVDARGFLATEQGARTISIAGDVKGTEAVRIDRKGGGVGAGEGEKRRERARFDQSSAFDGSAQSHDA